MRRLRFVLALTRSQTRLGYKGDFRGPGRGQFHPGDRCPQPNCTGILELDADGDEYCPKCKRSPDEPPAGRKR